MKMLAVAFTGPSNSGKTTTIINIATLLKQKGFKVVIVKHDPQDKAIFDKEGKDSYKFSQTGSDVVVVSPSRTTVFKQEPSSIEEIAKLFGEFDYMLVEGLKTIPLPRIAIFRDQLDSRYFDVSDAIATDSTISKEAIPQSCTHLDMNNYDLLIQWIDENSVQF